MFCIYLYYVCLSKYMTYFLSFLTTQIKITQLSLCFSTVRLEISSNKAHIYLFSFISFYRQFIFFSSPNFIYSLDLTVSLMDQMHWPVTSLHPSIETYQEDISYKFHIVYFINTSNLNNHAPKSSRY